MVKLILTFDPLIYFLTAKHIDLQRNCRNDNTVIIIAYMSNNQFTPFLVCPYIFPECLNICLKLHCRFIAWFELFCTELFQLNAGVRTPQRAIGLEVCKNIARTTE